MQKFLKKITRRSTEKTPLPLPDTDRLLHWLTSRRSIRRYQKRDVPGELLTRILEAATWAPSAHNRQPWRFAVLSQAMPKEQLARAMGRQLRHDLTADNVPTAVINRDVTRSFERLTQAPALILLSLSMTDMDDYPDRRRRQNEWIMAVQSVAMAGQNLLLAAHALGLAGCWMCAPLFCPEVVKNTLSLPADWQPQGLVTLGYPAEVRHKSRRPLAGQVQFID